MGQTLVLVEKEVLEHLEGLPVAVERLTDMVSRLSVDKKKDSGPKLIDTKEAAEYIGMSPSFLSQSRMTGPLKNRTPAPPYVKIGKSVMYRRSDLDAWLDSLSVETHERICQI